MHGIDINQLFPIGNYRCRSNHTDNAKMLPPGSRVKLETLRGIICPSLLDLSLKVDLPVAYDTSKSLWFIFNIEHSTRTVKYSNFRVAASIATLCYVSKMIFCYDYNSP